MLINSALWNVWNPGRYLPRNNHIYLARDGKTEIQGEDESAGRPLLAVVGSVLTFGIFFRKKRGYPPFEELNDYPIENRQA